MRPERSKLRRFFTLFREQKSSDMNTFCAEGRGINEDDQKRIV